MGSASKEFVIVNLDMKESTARLKLVQIIAAITDTVRTILNVSASLDSKDQIAL